MGQRYFGYSGSSPDGSHTPINLGNLDNQVLLQAELERRQQSPETPIRFAHIQSVNLDMTQAASWEVTDDGMLIGKLKLKSSSAHSLNLHFSEFDIPEDALLNLYNPITGQSHRQFTRSDVESHRQLWTPIIFGDIVMLEVVTTEQDVDKVNINIQSVYHDYLGFNTAFERKSGGCNLDVICGQNDGFENVEQYRKQITSVGAYHFNGQEICSGVAINNADRDCTPYFLTANHCGVNQGTALSMVVYWNYENSYCRQPNGPQSSQEGDGQLNQYNVGAFFKARDILSDFALVELDDPIDQQYNIYLSGWDRSNNLPSQTVAIHHPGVEEKRISFDYDAPEIDFSSSGQGKRIKVNDWDVGTTEGGSSGCPLFSEEGLIIGQLVGGTASCSNSEWDIFGWFHKSWDANNSSGSSLESWLDPKGLSGDKLTGQNCSYMLNFDQADTKVCNTQPENSHEIVISANSAFSESAMLQIVEDAGLDISLLVTQIDFNSSATLQVNDIHSVDPGDYLIKLKGNNSQVDLNLDINLNVVETSPEKPILAGPQNMAEGINEQVILDWVDVPHSLSYQVTVSIDENFNQGLIEYREVEESQIEFTQLTPNERYYWKVKAMNVCGEGEWSQSYQFSTGFEFCTQIVNTSDQLIDATSNIYYYPLDCTHDVNIKSLQIDNIRGTHDYISDLYFWVKKGLQQVFLWGGGCGSSKDYSIGFSIDRPSTASCPITDGRIYKPAQTYEAMLNTEAKGLWQIRVEDKEAEDGGTIDQAMITICFDEVYGDALVPSSNVLFICDEEVELDLYSNVLNNGALQLKVETDDHQTIPYTTNVQTQDASSGIYKVKLKKSDIEGSENLVLKALSSTVEFTTSIALVPGENAAVNSIVFPQQDFTTSSDILLEFEVESLPSLGTELQVALDPEFDQIIFLGDFGQNSILEVDYVWEAEVTYYARTLNSTAFKNCRGISEVITFYGSAISDISSQVGLPSITIAPNPATDNVLITLENSESSLLNIALYTIEGNLVYDQSYGNNQVFQSVVNVSHLPKGLYFVRLELKDHSYVIDKISVQ